MTQYIKLTQLQRTMSKTTKIIKGMKVIGTNSSLTTDMEAMEVEVDSLGIETTDHIILSNVSHVKRKDKDIQTVHTRTGLT